MPRFLVTGGAGFIGSHLVEKLLEEGHFVRVLDNFYSGKDANLAAAREKGKDRFELMVGDIRDPATCDKACKGMEYVFHQAALRSVPKSLVDPQNYNAVNIDGILHMLQAARKHKVKRFVFASSSSVYGDVEHFPQKEDFNPLLISPYALSKLAGEYYCRIFAKNFGLETVSLRYFNVFGPGQALDDEYAVVVPKFVHCLLNDQPPPVFGNGKQSRDFTYVDNVVSANILAAKAGGETSGEIFNIANGRDQTLLVLIETLNRILKKSIQPEFLPVRKGDVFKTHADISKARQVLGYQPFVAFEEGLEKVVESFKGQVSRSS